MAAQTKAPDAMPDGTDADATPPADPVQQAQADGLARVRDAMAEAAAAHARASDAVAAASQGMSNTV